MVENNVMERTIEVNKIYRHFKGKYYYVKDIAYDGETLEPCVVYQALYDEHKTWIRKLSVFLDDIDVNKEGNITHQSHRFEPVDLSKEEIK